MLSVPLRSITEGLDFPRRCDPWADNSSGDWSYAVKSIPLDLGNIAPTLLALTPFAHLTSPRSSPGFFTIAWPWDAPSFIAEVYAVAHSTLSCAQRFLPGVGALALEDILCVSWGFRFQYWVDGRGAVSDVIDTTFLFFPDPPSVYHRIVYDVSGL